MAATSLMDATLAVPQVLVAHKLTTTETVQYTCPADSWAKIGVATLANSGSNVTVSVSVVKPGTMLDLGGTVRTSGSNNPPPTASCIFTRPDHVVTISGTLTSVVVGVAVAGTLGISIGTIVGSVYTERTRVAAVSVGTGVQTLTPNIAVYAGEIVGIFGTMSVYHGSNPGGSNADYAIFATGAVLPSIANWEWGFQISVSGTGGGGPNRVLPSYPLAAGDSMVLSELKDVFLSPGDSISAIASANSVSFVVSGVVFS